MRGWILPCNQKVKKGDFGLPFFCLEINIIKYSRLAMKLFELLNNPPPPPVQYDLSQVKQQLNVHWVDVDWSLTKEEQQLIQQKFGTIPSLGDRHRGNNHEIPVITSHVVTQKGNEGLLHAIKMRDSNHVMPPALIKQMINQSVSLIVGNDRLVNRDRAHDMDTKQRALEIVRKYIAKSNPIIIPMPSSSPLTKMFADALATQIGSRVSDVLIKNPFPEKSKYIKTKSRGFEPSTDTDRSLAEKHRENVIMLKKVTAKIQQLDNSDVVTDDILDQIEQLHAQQRKLQQLTSISHNKFQKKILQSKNGAARRYYDYIQHQGDVQHVHEQPVILVDDNIVTGETLEEAIKSFLRQGIKPKIVGCICIHKYL